MCKILITGACGQLGSELIIRLRAIHGNENVIASDIRQPSEDILAGPFEYIDVLNKDELAHAIDQFDIDQIYHLAALLSAKAEQNISLAWELNIQGLLNVLNLAKEKSLDQVFWPSSIAVFGPDAPKHDTKQNTVLNPTTVYGISKVAGEQWCAYYQRNFGIDVRSLRYPGLIGYRSLPGGGTTDYAVDIHYKALQNEQFNCFLRKDSTLPIMYMDDAINATLKLMQVQKNKIGSYTSYNLAAISFSPEEIAEVIRKYIPNFKIKYVPDHRQNIADSWPDSIDDSQARQQWGWEHSYDLDSIVAEMLDKLSEKKSILN